MNSTPTHAIKGEEGIAGFPERLLCVRQMRHLTQDELGRKIGKSGAYISHWETGERRPSIEHLRALSLALNTSADYLIDSNL